MMDVKITQRNHFKLENAFLSGGGNLVNFEVAKDLNH